jgi:hypothetical protein
LARWKSGYIPCCSEHCRGTPEQLAKGETNHNYGSSPPFGPETVGISVFGKDTKGQVFHTYSCYSCGVDMLNGAYHYLDLTPKGRDEANQGSNTQAWVRPHDEYEDGCQAVGEIQKKFKLTSFFYRKLLETCTSASSSSRTISL